MHGSLLAIAFDVRREVVALGAITGLAYGLVAIGLILAFRASRAINFAHGQVGALAAVVLGVLVERWHVAYWSAFVAALAIGAALAATLELTVVRRLRDAPPVLTLIGTLGASQVLLYVTIAVGSSLTTGALFPQPAGLPHTRLGALEITPASWAMLTLGPVAVLVIGLLLHRTQLGAAMRASAANQAAARTLGIAARRMSTLTWAMAGALSALTAALVLPTGVVPTAAALGPSLLLRALAAAALARMSGLATALAAGLAIGVAEQIIDWNSPGSGLPDVLLFAVIVVALVLRPPPGARLLERADWTALTRLPPLSAAARAVPLVRWAGPGLAVAALGLAALAPLVLGAVDLTTLATVACFGVVGLSVWVVTAQAGQLSLGQFALAGVGATFLVVIAQATHSTLLGLLAAPIGAAVVALALGLPALRLPGPLLAVSTLGFALACQSWLFSRSWALGTGATVPTLVVGPVRFRGEASLYLLALASLAGCTVLGARLGRGPVGRRLRAVRDNDQAARAFAIPATLVRLQAFALAGALAGLGGALLALTAGTIGPESFPASASIDVVAMAIVGGLALTAGPILGALYIVALPSFVHLSAAALAATSFGWLALLLISPGGLAGALVTMRRRVLGWLLAASGHDPAILDDSPTGPAEPSAASARLTMAAPQGPPARDAAAAAAPALELAGLHRSFAGVRAVEDFNLAACAGEIVALVGPNGAGKTTVFDLATGVLAPQRGRVLLDGADVTLLPTSARAARGLVRSFQDAALFSSLTVSEVVALGLERRSPTRLLPDTLGLGGTERARRAAVAELVTLLGLEPWAEAPVHTLSTGTRRIAEFACLLALEPRVLLLDEPSAGLAQPEAQALMGLLSAVQRRVGCTMLVIEHDLPLVLALADRVVVLAEGRVVAAGTPGDVSADPEARAVLGLGAAEPSLSA